MALHPLAALLFLLLAATATAAPLQYHTFTPTPLSSTPAGYAVDDELLTWTADPETEAAATTAAVETSLELNVAHRDALPADPTTTPEQLLRLRLDRDAARVYKISAAAQPNATHPNATRRGFSSSVVSGLAQGSGEYFTRIGVGTPPSYAYMVLDTGSDVVWLQCAPCRRCYSQSSPIFDPRRSRSYASVPCGTPLCRRLDVSGCDTRRRSCLYQVSYGDGSVTTGDFSTETLTFHASRVPRVALGCGHDNQGLFVAAAGLLGLGRGRLSFPSQAARRFGNRFSYCLVDRTSTTNQTNVRTSSVVFGDAAVPRGKRAAAVSFTPMLTNPKMDTFYYVDLVAVSVGGTRVAGLDLKMDVATGRGGVIVDSGTSVTRLARASYEAVRDAFRAGAAALREAPGGFSLFDTCYDLSGRKEVKVPTVVLHLGGGGAVSLPAANYLIPVDSRGTFCFAFAGTDGGVSIVGNIQQQGFRVVFDGERRRVGFAAGGC